MRGVFAVTVIFALTCAAAVRAECHLNTDAADAPQLAGCPKAVTADIEYEKLCYHFAGEITGDNPQRDEGVYAALRKHGCDDQRITCQRAKLLKSTIADKTIYNTFLNALHAIYDAQYDEQIQLSENAQCPKY